MLEFVASADDVLAVRIARKISSEDLDAVMDRLDRLMHEHEKVHVFVETQAIDGIELSGLASYSARALPLLGKLNRFGRVAIVADQAWIRLGTRIESAILPFISYRTFTSDERQVALAWVQGRGAET